MADDNVIISEYSLKVKVKYLVVVEKLAEMCLLSFTADSVSCCHVLGSNYLCRKYLTQPLVMLMSLNSLYGDTLNINNTINIHTKKRHACLTIDKVIQISFARRSRPYCFNVINECIALALISDLVREGELRASPDIANMMIIVTRPTRKLSQQKYAIHELACIKQTHPH